MTASKPGVMDSTVNVPGNDMPVAGFMMSAFMDTVIHGWDLAKATEQDASFSTEHAEIILQAFEPQMENLRASGSFGPAVSVSEGASPQDRLIAIFGRQP